MPRKKEIEIVLDTETTGLDYTRERIIEFAAVRLENGKIVDEYQTLINPHQHIRKSSIAIHGITQEMVEDAPSEEEVMPKILEFIGDYPIVAHNAIFDYSFLNEAKLRLYGTKLENPHIDTQMMFKEIAPELSSRVKFTKINTDNNIEMARKYQVSGLPTLMVFKNGEPAERMVGLMPKSSIITNIEKHI